MLFLPLFFFVAHFSAFHSTTDQYYNSEYMHWNRASSETNTQPSIIFAFVILKHAIERRSRCECHCDGLNLIKTFHQSNGSRFNFSLSNNKCVFVCFQRVGHKAPVRREGRDSR